MTATAKVFMSGRSQAVRLPKEFRFDVDEVEIERTPQGVLLRPKSKAELLKSFFDRLEPFPENFMPDRFEGIDDTLRDPFAVQDKPRATKRSKRAA